MESSPWIKVDDYRFLQLLKMFNFISGDKDHEYLSFDSDILSITINGYKCELFTNNKDKYYYRETKIKG